MSLIHSNPAVFLFPPPRALDSTRYQSGSRSYLWPDYSRKLEVRLLVFFCESNCDKPVTNEQLYPHQRDPAVLRRTAALQQQQL